MCDKFLKYLEKKFSCFGQTVNDDGSSDEHSGRNSDGSCNSSHSDDDFYQEDSFKSYSEGENSGEDVVESTGRDGTRSSSYEECSSKTTGSTHTIENTEAPGLTDHYKKKKSPTQNTKKHVKIRVGSSTLRTEQEDQQKSPNFEKRRPKQTNKELPKASPQRNRSKQDRNLKKPQAMKDKTVKQKNDNRPDTAKQSEETKDEKAPRSRKPSLKVKETEKTVKPNHESRKSSLKAKKTEKTDKPNRENKNKEKIEKEKGRIKQPEEKRADDKKEKGKIPKAVRRTNQKSTPNNQEKSASSVLPKKIFSKKPESATQMHKPTKSNGSKIGTFSKGSNKSTSRRNVPTFTSKSIQKRRPMK